MECLCFGYILFQESVVVAENRNYFLVKNLLVSVTFDTNKPLVKKKPTA